MVWAWPLQSRSQLKSRLRILASALFSLISSRLSDTDNQSRN